ncbi:MAG: hypothetical protein ACP5O2_12045 [Bacteroidales bacterium]
MMASRKDAKKDIEYTLAEIITDTLNVMHLHHGKKDNELLDLLEYLIDSRDELISRLSHIPGKDNPAQIKLFFKKLYSDLEECAEKGMERLSHIIKSISE